MTSIDGCEPMHRHRTVYSHVENATCATDVAITSITNNSQYIVSKQNAKRNKAHAERITISHTHSIISVLWGPELAPIIDNACVDKFARVIDLQLAAALHDELAHDRVRHL
jgi:ABC-type enterochelin transport system substrate-binding protein